MFLLPIAALVAAAPVPQRERDAPFLPSPDEVVEAMLGRIDIQDSQAV